VYVCLYRFSGAVPVFGKLQLKYVAYCRGNFQDEKEIMNYPYHVLWIWLAIKAEG
jgi:hypothetical protein